MFFQDGNPNGLPLSMEHMKMYGLLKRQLTFEWFISILNEIPKHTI